MPGRRAEIEPCADPECECRGGRPRFLRIQFDADGGADGDDLDAVIEEGTAPAIEPDPFT